MRDDPREPERDEDQERQEALLQHEWDIAREYRTDDPERDPYGNVVPRRDQKA